MDPQSVLAQLRDVQAPDPVSWWPPAFGWWLLAALLIALLLFAVWSFRYWRKKTAWRREALRELRNLQASWAANHHPQTLSKLVILLKRSLASALQRPEILSQSGDQWRASLQQITQLSDTDTLNLFSDAQYQVDSPALNKDAFQQAEKALRKVKC